MPNLGRRRKFVSGISCGVGYEGSGGSHGGSCRVPWGRSLVFPPQVSQAGLFALLIFLLTTGTFVLQAWSRLYILHLGYEIYQLEDERRQLLEENRRLLMEISNLRSPARIGRIAREELGLRLPKADEVVIISRQGQR